MLREITPTWSSAAAARKAREEKVDERAVRGDPGCFDVARKRDGA
jgi:hypothetical protein